MRNGFLLIYLLLGCVLCLNVSPSQKNILELVRTIGPRQEKLPFKLVRLFFPYVLQYTQAFQRIPMFSQEKAQDFMYLLQYRFY